MPCERAGRAPNGGTGQNGAPGNSGVAGANGAERYRSASGVYDYTQCVQHADWPELLAQATPDYLSMLLHEAELGYLNHQLADSADDLSWLSDLCQSYSLISDNALKASAQGVYTRSICLLGQMSKGLDFYGYPTDFVPLVALGSYQSALDNLLSSAQVIENACKAATDAQAASELAIANAQTAINGLVQHAAQLGVSQSSLLATINDLENEAESLLKEVLDTEQQVTVAEDDFKAAVARQSQCGFLDVLKVAGALVGAVATAGTAGAAIVGAFETGVANPQATGDRLKDLTKQFGAVIDFVKNVTADVEKIRDAYNSVKDALAQDRDKAKLVLARQDFEDAVKPYLDLPEAVKYRDLMRRYLDLSDTRNNRLLLRQSACIRYVDTQAEIDRLRTESLLMKDRIAAGNDPELSALASFLTRSLESVKINITRTLFMEHQAYRYWSLDSQAPPFTVDDSLVAQMLATHTILKAQILQQAEGRGGGLLKFSTQPSFEITEAANPHAFAYFRATGRLTFAIPMDSPSFRGWRVVKVSKVGVVIPNIHVDPFPGEQQSVAYMVLEHHGRGAFQNQNGDLLVFSHPHRLAAYSYSPDHPPGATDNQGDLVGQQDGDVQYAWLSPFSVWTLFVDAKQNPGLNLQPVDRVILNFDGVGYPPPPT